MSLSEYFALSFILYILIVQSIASRLSSDNQYDSEDEDGGHRAAKRILFHESMLASTQRTPSILENLIHPVSTQNSTTETQKTAFSPLHSSLDPCALNPCEHEGRCVRTGQMNYECKCVGPWRGMHCNVADACYSFPCQNGGACLNVYDDYWCQCPKDFYGPICQNKFSLLSTSENHCRPNTCFAGKCISLQTTFYCECPEDRYGERCEKKMFKRELSKRQLYKNLFNQLKRNMFTQRIKNKHNFVDDEDVAYYDVRNGIYF